MQLIRFLYIPIVAIALTLSANANSLMWHYDLMKVVSLDGNKIVLKDLGALDPTLFTRSDLRSSSKMLCSYSPYTIIEWDIDFSGKRISDEDFELDCKFIKLKHPTVSSGDYAVYVSTDMGETQLIVIDPSKFDYVKTMLSYNRENWSFNSSTSPLSSSTIGWYTGVTADATDVDHVVSLKDAYLSGGHSWSADEKRTFANDPSNHVTALPYVNRTLKNSKTPLRFINHINYVIRYAFASGKCLEYVDLYVQIKEKYKLNFINNSIDLAKAACR